MKIWFDLDCEIQLSTMQDLCVDCEEMYCPEASRLINEVEQHRKQGCHLAYIDEKFIKVITLSKKENGITVPVTVDDLEKVYLKGGILPNFAYALARIQPLTHKVLDVEGINNEKLASMHSHK